MNLRTRDFGRILLIKPSALGDIIHALPVLSGLRQRYPRAHISWLVNREYLDLLAEHPLLDQAIPFDRQALRSIRGTMRWALDARAFVRNLRQQRFELAIDLQGLFRSGLLAWVSGAPVRLGFRPAREGAGVFYNRTIPTSDRNVHAVDRNYQVARVLGFDMLPIDFPLNVAADHRDVLRQILGDLGLEPHSPYAVVVPGSRWETKNWDPDRFAAVIDRLHHHPQLGAVLSGSPSERPLCERIARQCRRPVVNLAGRLNLPEWVALIEQAAVVLCNDSAALHVAAALGRPLVTIFGPTDPRRTGPYGSPAAVLQAPLDCAPCYIRKLSGCGFQHQCMKDITVGQVHQAVAEAVAAPRTLSAGRPGTAGGQPI